MDDVIERLRRLDPVPEQAAPLSYEVLLSQLGQELDHPPLGLLAPDASDRRPRWLPGIGALVATASVAIVIVIGLGALVLLGRDDRSSQPQAPSGTPDRRQLIDMLGVLRRPQVATDIDHRLIGLIEQRDSRLEMLGQPDVPLMRRVVSSWGESLYLVAFKPPSVNEVRAAWKRMTGRRPPLRRFTSTHDAETLGLFMSNGGGGGSASAADIQYVGSDAFVGGRFAGLRSGQGGYQYLIRVVPDGVTKVMFVVRGQIGRAGHGASANPPPATITVTVHNNVAAARIRRQTPAKSFEAIWYGHHAHILKRSFWP